MKRYIALVASYGFQKRLWNEGDTVELPDDHKCPEYFKPIEQFPDPVPVLEEPKTFSEINEARKALAPKTGMAHTAPEAKPEPKKSSKKK